MSNGLTVYLTPKELSERYKGRISVGTLANWRARGFGPKFVKVGDRVLYALDAVEKWEAQNEKESTK